MIVELIRSALNKKFEEPEFEDCFLVDVEKHGERKYQVFMDRDKGIDFKTCRTISRYLEAFLDSDDRVNSNYILEVSSPGIDRGLTVERQYPRNIGRKLKLKLKNGRALEGKLTEFDGHKITLEAVKGKKQILNEVTLDDVLESKVIVSFK